MKTFKITSFVNQTKAKVSGKKVKAQGHKGKKYS